MTAEVLLDWRWSLRLFGRALREFRVAPQGLIHVGAHRGEEVPIYLACGFERVTLVEPDSENCDVIAAQPWIEDGRVGIVRAACVAPGAPRTATFHRSEITPFSGLREDRRRPVSASFTVDTLTVSEVQRMYGGNVLVIDTQGTEMDALAGAALDPLDMIVIETQIEGPEAFGAYLPQLEEWCADNGWVMAQHWRRDNGWSDTVLRPARMMVT